MASINYDNLLKQFKKEYNFLYDNRDRVCGYSEAVAWFDEYIKTESGKRTVGIFNTVRHDIITSDREAGAFAFAMESLGYIA